MAKFFITNSPKYYKLLKEQISQTDFSLSFDNECEGIYALATHKLGMQNVNAVKEGNDFCIATGTCIYKESLDYTRLLNDFATGGIHSVRRNTIGAYGVCVKNDDGFTIFQDPLAAYDIYYYNQDNVILVSNSLYDMAYVLKHNIHLNEEAIFERTICRSVLNGKSFFHEINRLRKDEFLRISGQTLKVVTLQETTIPIHSANDEDYDLMVSQTAKQLKENARIIGKVFGKPTLFATGGLDSRMVLAAFLSNGIKPNLYYGKDNLVANPGKYSQEQDAYIAELYAKRFNLDLTIDDWSIGNPVDKDWDDLIKNHGFLAAYIWGASANMINNLTKHSSSCLLFGWGGELYRVSMTKQQYHSLYEYVKNVFVSKSVDVKLALEVEPSFVEIMYQKIKTEYVGLGLDASNTNNDELYMIELLYRAQADTQIPSFLMQYKYCYLPAFEPSLLANRVSWDKMKQARFQIDVIYAMYSQIFDVPIYSSNKYRYLNREKMVLEDELVQPQKQSPIRNAKKLIKKILRPLKRGIKHILRNTENQSIAIAESKYIIPQTDVISNQRYNINPEAWKYTENAAIWGILHRALKILGY